MDAVVQGNYGDSWGHATFNFPYSYCPSSVPPNSHDRSSSLSLSSRNQWPAAAAKQQPPPAITSQRQLGSNSTQLSSEGVLTYLCGLAGKGLVLQHQS